MLRPLLLVTLISTGLSAAAQPKPSINFRTLQTGHSAREAALGGRVLAIEDQDLNLAVFTPSLLSKSLDNTLAFNYVNYFSDINFGYLSYAKSLKDQPLTFSGTIRYFNYGKTQETDEFFNTYGTFSNNEYVIQGGAAWQMDTNWRVGANLKYIHSSLAGYGASAIATDASVTYFDYKRLFGASFVITDLGVVTKNYNGQKGGRLPFDVAIGLSKKLAKSPLRFSLTLDNLTTWDLTYTDPNVQQQIDPLTGEVKTEKTPSFGNKLFRHAYGGTEIVFSKNFHIRVGYNYRRRQELKINDRAGTVGLSWGFAMRISKFQLSYARTKYHLSSPSNHFTLSTNLSTFGKK
ncbi:MAG: type IX secretion system protein PorQ [Bacteroidota bacterium]